MKIGESTREMLSVIGTILGLLAVVMPAGFLADYLEGAVGIGAALAVVFGWPCLFLLGMALYFDNRP